MNYLAALWAAFLHPNQCSCTEITVLYSATYPSHGGRKTCKNTTYNTVLEATHAKTPHTRQCCPPIPTHLHNQSRLRVTISMAEKQNKDCVWAVNCLTFPGILSTKTWVSLAEQMSKMDKVSKLFLPLHVVSLEIKWEPDPPTSYQEIWFPLKLIRNNLLTVKLQGKEFCNGRKWQGGGERRKGWD